MLYYLDNWLSEADSSHPTGPEARIESRRRATMNGGTVSDSLLPNLVKRRTSGPNENYARELMELHTLGVDGGYSQRDVNEVARAFTGWTIWRHDLGGEFLFMAPWHDAGAKVVLGHALAGGRGIEDGEDVLDLVSRHPSTARFIALKLATRLVCDRPPKAIVDAAAQTFTKTDGDIREVIRTIVTSPGFLGEETFRSKVKTPFEFVVSTARALGAFPDTTARTADAIAQLGQPVWGRDTPDGWPDNAQAWMNHGGLLGRVNFATGAVEEFLPEVDFSIWATGMGLPSLTSDAAVQRVVDVLLWGKASADTRKQMLRAMITGQELLPPINRLSRMVAVALSSPEFQRR